MEFSVTIEHIKQGERASSGSCPIALALKDTGATSISVNTKTMHFLSSEGNPENYQHTEDVARWIRNFDQEDGTDYEDVYYAPCTIKLEGGKAIMTHEEEQCVD